ncbi:MAG: DsbC family protein [Arenimonas sp.]|nr:DsbC family protein [Arenimonas sp.]
MAQTKPAAAPAKPAATQAKPAAAQAKPATAPAGADAALRASILKAVPGAEITSIKPSPIPGYREVAINGRIVYVSADGKYLVQGSLIELSSRDNLTAASEAVIRRADLDAVPRDRRIIFSPPNPKFRITVFTDIDCGYCRKMHTQISEYNKLGISVEYLFFPRSGPNTDSFTKAISVWCSADRRRALTDAKADRTVPRKTCANPIAMDYELGRRIGVDGTPAIYAPDGTQIGGYVAPAEMLVRLERQATKSLAAK